MKCSIRRSRILFGFFFFITSCSLSQSVHPIDEKGLDSLRMNRHGKILVLNVWATWCIPCKEEFPDLIRLSNDPLLKNVAFAAISVDFQDEVETNIKPFLRTMRPPFDIFVSAFQSQDDFFVKFDSTWSGAIPATFIYDKYGKQQKFLIGKQSYQQLKKAIEDVLGKP